MSIDDMDKSEEEMKKIRSFKNTWYSWLVNYIPEPIRESVGGFKDKFVSIFTTRQPNKIVHGRRKKLSKQKTENKLQNCM